MKVAVVTLALAAATAVSSAAPSHDFAARAPEPAFWNHRGCPYWWQICGLKAKRDAAGAASTSQEAIADHYAGIAKEFPTAPRDSFLIANSDYIAARTGSDT